VAAATLGSGYIWPPQGAPFFLFNGLLLLYLVFSLVVAIRGIRPGGLLGLLALFGDAVYFLVLVSFGVGRLWLASVYFLYLLAEAVAFYGPVEVVVVVAVAAVFCAVLPHDGIGGLEPTVLVAGVLTCGFAVHKRRRETRIGQLNQKLEEVQKDAEKARDAERQRIASDFHDGRCRASSVCKCAWRFCASFWSATFVRACRTSWSCRRWRNPRSATCACSSTACVRWTWMGHPGGHGPAQRRILPEGKRHSGDVSGTNTPWACRRK